MITFGFISGFSMLFILGLTLLPTVVALVDILKSEFKGNDKIVWVLVVLFFNIIGAIIYFTIGRNQKIN